MTDEQIVKALKVISTTANCNECAFRSGKVCNCSQVTAIQSLALIKRQQAEIEDLKADKEALINGQLTIQKMYIDARAEAVRECIKKIKSQSGVTVAITNDQELYETKVYAIRATKLDEILKEMTEGK